MDFHLPETAVASRYSVRAENAPGPTNWKVDVPAIDFNDFTTQLISAVVLGLILLLVHRSWMRNVKGAPAPQSAMHHRGSISDPAVIDEDALSAEGWDAAPREDHGGARATILHDIETSPDAVASDDDYGKVVFVLLAMAVAALLFLLARPMVEALSYGIIVSTVLMALVATYRTQILKVWSGRAVAAAITVMGAGVTAVVTWTTMGDLRRDGMSVGSINDVVPAFSENPDKGTLVNYFDYVVEVVLPSLFSIEAGLLPFVASLLLGAMAVAALCAFALSAVWDWNAYLSFSKGPRKKKNVVARARSHQEGGPVGLLVWAAAFAAVAVVSANGIPYDTFMSLTSQ